MLLVVCRGYLGVKLPKNFVPFPVISREGTKPGGQWMRNLLLYPPRLVFYRGQLKKPEHGYYLTRFFIQPVLLKHPHHVSQGSSLPKPLNTPIFTNARASLSMGCVSHFPSWPLDLYWLWIHHPQSIFCSDHSGPLTRPWEWNCVRSVLGWCQRSIGEGGCIAYEERGPYSSCLVSGPLGTLQRELHCVLNIQCGRFPHSVCQQCFWARTETIFKYPHTGVRHLLSLGSPMTLPRPLTERLHRRASSVCTPCCLSTLLFSSPLASSLAIGCNAV